ncbi:transketolase family protein [Alicyclobacillus vulcanalis]|uniref:Transketolase subunit B n=1 Tax=Alicyclobacillus vulcanalis TaxID=252246 RepID=A0A1N7PGG8_9BACL|nr:transketolase C-terminal domain-containing protein [Alicyclobacillus vulcanalis]SIT09668.1 transketolase subunit B [Alicyclobacillus vulcanalis]
MTVVALRQVFNEVLMEIAPQHPELVVLTSDSRGSAALSPFAQTYPKQFIEVGIAEQNIVGIASGLASCGYTPFVFSPACFLSMRAIEQIKVDVAYSGTNVKLIGISGGVSYGTLGMSHHSLQDIAVTRAIPGLQVVLPSDRFEVRKLVDALLTDRHGTYVRIGRNPVRDVYADDNFAFEIGKAVRLRQGEDVTLVSTGEMVRLALDVWERLAHEGISATVLNMHTLKPFDRNAILAEVNKTRLFVTLEEHSIHGGLGGAVAEVLSQECPKPLLILGIPDEPAVTGSQQEILAHYGLTPEGVTNTVLGRMKRL